MLAARVTRRLYGDPVSRPWDSDNEREVLRRSWADWRVAIGGFSILDGCQVGNADLNESGGRHAPHCYQHEQSVQSFQQDDSRVECLQRGCVVSPRLAADDEGAGA